MALRGIETIRRADSELAALIESRHGCIVEHEVPRLIEINRLMKVLVRCGRGQFTCPVQNVNHFIEIIEEHCLLKASKTGEPPATVGDYIRDVSLPAE